jgi:drug/metabolite transporter (DMT)-like permease
LAFPATLVYTPIALTLLDDVLNHAFRLQDRYLLLFALGVAAVMLAAFYGVVVRFRGRPVGAEIGLTLAMALLLAAVPCSMLLLGLENWVSAFPPPGGLE